MSNVYIHAGLHCWKPRPSSRTQSVSAKRDGFFFSLIVVGDGVYVAGVAPPFPAISIFLSLPYKILHSTQRKENTKKKDNKQKKT